MCIIHAKVKLRTLSTVINTVVSTKYVYFVTMMNIATSVTDEMRRPAIIMRDIDL